MSRDLAECSSPQALGQEEPSVSKCPALVGMPQNTPCHDPQCLITDEGGVIEHLLRLTKRVGHPACQQKLV